MEYYSLILCNYIKWIDKNTNEEVLESIRLREREFIGKCLAMLRTQMLGNSFVEGYFRRSVWIENGKMQIRIFFQDNNTKFSGSTTSG